MRAALAMILASWLCLAGLPCEAASPPLHGDRDAIATEDGAVVAIEVDPYDASAWIATDRSLLLHIAQDGTEIRRTLLPAIGGPVAIALDQSVWAVAGDQLLHFASDGRWLAARPFPRGADADTAPTALAVDSLGDQLWIATAHTLQRLPLRDPSESLIDVAEGAIAAMTLDQRSGDAWIIIDKSLLAIGRDGTRRPVLDPEMGDVAPDATLFFDSETSSVLVAGSDSLTRIRSAGNLVDRIPLAPDATVLAPPPFRIDPALALVRPPDGAATYDRAAEIVLGVEAYCNGAPCGLPPGYAKGLHIDAEMNGVPMIAAIGMTNPERVSFRPGRPLSAGPNRLTARVTDRFGHRADLAPANLTVIEPAADAPMLKASNKAPTVALTAPANGAAFTAGTSIALIATASDPDGAIAKVEFYRDGTTLIGTATAAPYKYTWPNVVAGSYSLTAKAYDNRNGTTVSASVAIVVSDNRVPIVTLTSPDSGSFFAAGAPIPLAASASDTDGTIARVEFLDGSTLIGVAPAAPFGLPWTTASPGAHSIRARATDNKGATSDSAAAAIVVGQPPRIVVTSPAACSKIDGPVDLVLTADAFSPNDAIVQVDFFDGGALVGTSHGSPWRVTLANASPGSHSITARATDGHGLTATSRPSMASVLGANQPPVVALISPVDGATFPIGTAVNLSATATDADGSVVAVEYHAGAGGPLIGRATSAPYASTWSNMSPGSYALVAIASDDRGATTTSTAIHVTIEANRAPSISLTAPAANASFTAPATIDLAANATDVDGTVAKVEFFAGPTLVGTSTAPPYAAHWSNASAGAYSITAKATDNLGAAAVSAPVPITITDNARPAITITSPASGAQYFAPATIDVTATATDSDGTVAKVEFHANGVLIGTASTAPYSIIWDNVPGGSYTLTAVATDNQGGTTTSAGIGVSVTAQIAIIPAPGLDGSTVEDDSIVISGVIDAPANSGVVVNGVIAQIDSNGHFYANGVSLEPGANTIVMTLVSQDGQTATKTIAVSSNGVAPFAVSASPTTGLAPLAVTLVINNRANVAFQRIDIDLDDDGAVDYMALPNQFDKGNLGLLATYSAGSHTTRVTVFDADDVMIYTTTRVITVRTAQQQDALLKSVYNGMLDRLRTGRISDALKAVSGDMQDKYNAVFTSLGAALPAAVAELGTLESNWFAADHAEYVVIRDTSEGPRGFLVDFVRGEDGVWRIDGM